MSQATSKPQQQRYEQQLDRKLSAWGGAVMAMSAAAPAVTVFLYVPVVIQMAGTWVFYASLIGVAIIIVQALLFSELCTAVPVTNGAVGVVSRLLSPGWGFALFVLSLVSSILIQATYAIGAGMQLQGIWPSIDPRLAGAFTLIACGIVALLNVRVGKTVNTVMLVVQILACVFITVLGLAHAHDPGRLFHIEVLDAWGGTGAALPLTWGLLLGGVTVAYFNLAGATLVGYFAEEIRNPTKRIFRAMMLTMVLLIVLVFLPTIAVLLGAPNLKDFVTNPAPMSYFMDSLGVGSLGTFISLVIYVAFFNSLVAAIMFVSRLLWGGARDGFLPGAPNRWLATIHPRYKSPYVASALVTLLMAGCCFVTSLNNLVSMTAFFGYVTMISMAVAGLVIRRRTDLPEHFLAPLWPAVPLLAAAIAVVIASGQSLTTLTVAGATILVALVYYFTYLWPRRETRWVMAAPPLGDEAESAVVTSAEPVASGDSI